MDQPTEDHDHGDYHHHRGHGHHHHQHGHDSVDGHYAQANKEHYDHNAPELDNYPHAKERAKRGVVAIRNAVKTDQETTRVMEFACGTGLVSKELAPYVQEIVGVDISQAVVDRYNQHFAQEGSNDRFRAICADLKGQEGELEGKKFDFVFCASAYHHFDSIEQVTLILVSFLKPGGALLIIDNAKTADSTIPEQYRHIVAHIHGFGEGDIQKLFEGADLEFAGYNILPPDEGDNEIFIAKGIKKST